MPENKPWRHLAILRDSLSDNIYHMLIRQGFDKTLEYLSTFSVFSILSKD